MNTKKKLNMKTDFPDVIRCKVYADIAPLEDVANLPLLFVLHQRSHEPFASERGDFRYVFHPTEGTFALTYFCERDCITFLFDAWSPTTRDHLARARDQGGLVITLLGAGGPTWVGGGTRSYWVGAIEALDAFRTKQRPRDPLDFATLDVLNLVAAYGVPPQLLTNSGASGPTATSVIKLLDRGHAAALVAAGL